MCLQHHALVPTFSSPPPPSLPVISVWDAVYEYETVDTLHSQTHADTQDTVEHQTIRQRQKKRERTRKTVRQTIDKSASPQRIYYNMEAYLNESSTLDSLGPRPPFTSTVWRGGGGGGGVWE